MATSTTPPFKQESDLSEQDKTPGAGYSGEDDLSSCEKGPTPARTRRGKGDVVLADDGVKREGGLIGKMWQGVLYLDKFGVEVNGVERILEEDRHHMTIMDSGFLWCSANLTISTFSLGTLGNSIWGMGLTDACLVIVFFNLLCTIPVAMFSTWGAQTGLRQMMIGRYSFGIIGIYLPVLLNCIACIGWSTINTIVGAQALAAVSTSHELPIAAGIVIIAVITLFVALFGYKYVHAFERYASVPVFVIFVIMLGQAAPYMSASMSAPGVFTAANCLSFGGTIAGFALGWTSLAADYTVNFPADSSKFKVFTYTYVGLNLPLIFVECLGAAMMTTFTAKTTWEAAYESHELGGLLGAPLIGPMGGFGRFLLVILALSIVANNIPNMYSFALTFQAFGKYAQSIPRIFLVIIGTAIYIALAIVGASSFESILDNMLVILSYWLAIYSTILIEEHYIFRKGSFRSGYDLDAYNTLSELPYGFAAMVALGFGVMGAVFGMAQVWYVGILGRLIGDPSYGGDIGFELAAAFTAIAYPPLRYAERKLVGR